VKKIGRKPKKKEERLSALVSFACTEAEEQQICRAARVERSSVSAYIRKQLKDLRVLL
jgi:hypothetical protein